MIKECVLLKFIVSRGRCKTLGITAFGNFIWQRSLSDPAKTFILLYDYKGGKVI